MLTLKNKKDLIFWQQFRGSMETVLGNKLAQNFQTLYLWVRPMELVDCGKKYMYNILLAAANKSITKRDGLVRPFLQLMIG